MKISLICGIIILFTRIALPCGIDWGEPRSKIEGCNEQGYVLIAEKLADLNVPGETATIPIWATFDSSRQSASPYVGMGWQVPFLECNLVQISEDEFQLIEPGGWKRLFRRIGKNSDILDGGGGWKGQLSPDHATLWADCGWRIDLHKGKIVQLKTPHGQAISYNYTNGRISSVMCGVKTLIALDPADGIDHTLGITIDGKNYSIAKTDQPRVQHVAGVNVIAGNDESFNKLTGTGKQTRIFTYSVDDQTRPAMTMITTSSQETAVSWNPETRWITRYGEWQYNIKTEINSFANAAIERTNSKGQNEYWFYDAANGQETTQGVNKVRIIKKWFTSGATAGKLREIENVVDGKTTLLRHIIYDETGKVVRDTFKDNTLDLHKGYISVINNNSTVWKLDLKDQDTK
jgi:hypothetical protein